VVILLSSLAIRVIITKVWQHACVLVPKLRPDSVCNQQDGSDNIQDRQTIRIGDEK
jgi:hypothetical protein